jgi:hypothetical protein
VNNYKKIAREVYERTVDEHQGRCTKDQIRDALTRELTAHGLADDILHEFVEGLLKGEDDRQAKKQSSPQLDILTGEEEALDAVLRLGENTRVRARAAHRDDIYAWLALKSENAARTAEAFAREQRRYAQLIPYMTNDQTTVEEAVEQYLRNGGGG